MSQDGNYNATITALIAPTITDRQPCVAVDTTDWNIPSNVKLADPAFNKPQRVDLLLGASIFFDLLCVGQIKLGPSLPILQKTRLGWIVSGGGSESKNTALLTSRSASVDDNSSSDVALDELVRRFWEVESMDEAGVKVSKEERLCEEHFVQNFSRLTSGDYSVRLPFKQNADLLDLKKDYADFIHEYLQLNHMSRVDPELMSQCKYFLPHHCVIKESSTTTKLRVVFDGSASTSSGYSLNEVMMAGPVIQPKLLHILIRFRTYLVALTGDISKMYRCVRLSAPDNYYQCIIWRDAPDRKLEVYKLDTVTYGTKAASFLSVRAMHQLAHGEKDAFPIGSDALLRDFYVDDFISGGDSVAQAVDKMNQTAGILSRGNFKLRKWCSSHPEVLDNVADDDKEKFVKFDDGSTVTKTLGLAWDPAVDCLPFSLMPLQPSKKPCRRSVLSTVAILLGLVGPVIIKAKIFLQQLCKDKLDWDESLPVARNTAWTDLCSDFHNVRRLSFPRFLVGSGGDVDIHGFCDASLDAYGACVYVASKGHAPTAYLLCAKSRVAPLKTLSVPKLELCGAVLLAKLMREIMELNIFNAQFLCWCDSSVALAWISDEPFRFNVFVANRVAAIQELTPSMKWLHVPTALNPADIISRGASPEVLVHSELWFHVPPYLREKAANWPTSSIPEKSSLELRKTALLVLSPHVDITQACKYANCFKTFQRIFAYVYKFIKRIRHADLTVSDLHNGTRLLVRMVQLGHLWEDIRDLRAKGVVKRSSSIASLLPFIDEFGLVRVGGRLKNSSLPFDARHPIILPRRHPITHALIDHAHKRNLHTGSRALLAKIRLEYWPIGGLRTVSKAVRRCVICFRAKPRFLEPIMAQIPSESLHGARPFAVTGIDYCGPFFYKSEVRNRSPIKAYISVFICFTSKAIHMELVKDLSTATFLSALKRFIALRAKPSQIWSDNATNFVGARNQLEELRQLMLSDQHMETVRRWCLTDCIEWKFIPPRSPHFGGLWEAAVKSAKHHLHRSIGNSCLNSDELRTLVCQITAVVNSRPLLFISENPEDLDVLTPAHLLLGGPAATIIEPDLTKFNYDRLDGWQRVTQLQQQFWNRWREEYLTLLQQRSKWRSPSQSVQINDVVLVKNENLPPMRWSLARVVAIFPGHDGVVRVADLRTEAGVIRRAVSKLCLLPLSDVVERQASNGGSMSGAAVRSS